jgi:hypothetical protein
MRTLRARLRPALGSGFLLVRVSWFCLVASLALALLMALDMAPPRAVLLFGLLLVPGWLLTFLLGVLQRIVPFLASVHASAAARGTPLISALTPAPLLAAHQALHVAALASLQRCSGSRGLRAPARRPGSRGPPFSPYSSFLSS